MIEVIRAGLQLQQALEQFEWHFCFIGGIAVQCWGEPRLTNDVDITLLTGFGEEAPFIQKLLERFEARVEDPAEFALRNRVLLLKSETGVGIDVALAALPFERRCIKRSRLHVLSEEVSLRVCSAEDLIVLKAFAGRAKDWGDLEGLMLRQGERLDWNYVRKNLKPLLQAKESPETLPQLLALRDRLQSR